jgi:hypothetical protein
VRWRRIGARTTVIDELDGFEGVVRGKVLRNVVPAVRSVPLDGPFYVGWEVVVGSAGDWVWLGYLGQRRFVGTPRCTRFRGSVGTGCGT